jgi:hypothetical protein
MLMLISLFRLEPQITSEEYDQFMRSVIQRYTDYCLQQGISYLGQFSPYGLHDYDRAEIYLVNAPTLEDGQRRMVTSPNAPEDILAIGSIFRSCHIPHIKMNLWLEPVELSPFARSTIELAGRLLRFYFYVPHPLRSFEELRQFECRTQGPYTEFMRKIDWFYLGIFRAAGLLEPMVAGVDLVQASSPEEAVARDEACPSTPEIESIIAEARSFRHPNKELVMLWLKRTLLSPLAEAGFTLAKTDSKIG